VVIKLILNVLEVCSSSNNDVDRYVITKQLLGYIFNVRCEAKSSQILPRWAQDAGSIPDEVTGFFQLTYSFQLHYGPVVDSASNRNVYHKS
jgi:hypothetical protein